MCTSFSFRQPRIEQYVQPYPILKAFLLDIPFNFIDKFIFYGNYLHEFDMNGLFFVIYFYLFIK